MSIRDVADMLALAHQGFSTASEQSDEQLRRMSIQLASKAFSHPDAAVFFGGLQLAVSELVEEKPWGNDPDIDDNDEGVMDPQDTEEDDEEAPEASSPAYEGVTDEDGDKEDDMQSMQDRQKESSALKALASNFRRLGMLG